MKIMGDPNQEIAPDETQILLDRLAEMMDSLEWDWFLSAAFNPRIIIFIWIA